MTDFYVVQNPNNEINVAIAEGGISQDPELRGLLDTNAEYQREINRLTRETQDFNEVVNAFNTRTELLDNFLYQSLMETALTQGVEAFRAQLRTRMEAHGQNILQLQHYQSLSQQIQDAIKQIPIPVANVNIMETRRQEINTQARLEATRAAAEAAEAAGVPLTQGELNLIARQEARRAAAAARASAEAAGVPLTRGELNLIARQEARRAAAAARASAEAARAAAEGTDIVYEGRI